MDMKEVEILRAELHKRNVKVTFTKLDGEERKMLCTLNEQVVPAYSSNSEKHRKSSSESIVVWDMEKAAWRSFRKDSITTWE